jgi:probable ATP-dependent RNA helicase DDX4
VIGEDGKPLPPIYKPVLIDEDSENLYDCVPTGINFDRYEKIKVNVSGDDIPKPINAFKDVITSELINTAIDRCKYTKPTPVQKYAIPIIMQKRDLMACAQTGSGKTAAFELPVLQDLLSMSDLPSLYGQPVQEPLCVVISPTRELAIQIHTEAVKFAKGSIIKPALIYGGTSSGYQLANISRGAHFLVATPGRLLDFVNKGKISFAKLKYLILDEADRMIDQGFLPEVRRMVTHETMPHKTQRQTLMFSATFPDEVQNIAKEFLKDDYLFLTVGIVGSANSDVEQTFIEVEGKQKKQKLMDILKSSEITDRTLVFVEKKKTADFLASYLSQQGMKSTSIHGDRYQSQRETALYDFRSGRMPILVATSVAARGLDIKDVKHVINYDLPKEIDEYVHRIGRTGRVGNVGKATSFFDLGNDSDVSLAKNLIRILSDANQAVPDFLSNSASGNVGFSSASNGTQYGGKDVRGVCLLLIINIYFDLISIQLN